MPLRSERSLADSSGAGWAGRTSRYRCHLLFSPLLCSKMRYRTTASLGSKSPDERALSKRAATSGFSSRSGVAGVRATPARGMRATGCSRPPKPKVATRAAHLCALPRAGTLRFEKSPTSDSIPGTSSKHRPSTSAPDSRNQLAKAWSFRLLSSASCSTVVTLDEEWGSSCCVCL